MCRLVVIMMNNGDLSVGKCGWVMDKLAKTWVCIEEMVEIDCFFFFSFGWLVGWLIDALFHALLYMLLFMPDLDFDFTIVFSHVPSMPPLAPLMHSSMFPSPNGNGNGLFQIIYTRYSKSSLAP